MKKWKIDYIDSSDDLAHIWVYASSKEEAKQQAKSEYWDIKSIIQVLPMK